MTLEKQSNKVNPKRKGNREFSGQNWEQWGRGSREGRRVGEREKGRGRRT